MTHHPFPCQAVCFSVVWLDTVRMVLVIDAGAPTLFLDCQSFPHTEIVAVPFFRVATISIVWDGVGVKDRVGGTRR